MNKNVEKFYSLLMSNQEELSRIRKELREVGNEEDLINLIDLKIIPLAKKKVLSLLKKTYFLMRGKH